MKNLKRALSFAMAAVMLVGMMAIGTSAFTDDADIVNTKAVNVMNQLGIINGNPDGNFYPENTVTRGEMAKMICVALNGGKAPVLDTDVVSYTDTQGHWAAGYIEYCTSLGIVAGNPDGTFLPEKPITGTEAAKMVLIAVGYVAENEGFVNNKDWSTNINVVANKKDLYNKVTSLPGAPISRDNAAQMLYNGMNAAMVEYEYQLNSVNGNLTSVAVAKDKQYAPTILSTKFGMAEGEGVVSNVSWNDTDKVYDVTVEGFGAFELDTDVSALYRQKVAVLYKTGDMTDVYGIYSTAKIIATGTVADVDLSAWDAAKSTIKFDGVATKVNSTTIATYEFLDDASVSDLYTLTCDANNDPFAITLIDNTGDKVADIAVVMPYTYATVTYAGKTQVTTSVGVYSYENDTVYAGIADDDHIKVVAGANAVDGKNTITKVNTITATVEAQKTSTVKIGGEWYTDLSGTSFQLNKEYELVVINGYIYAAELTTEAYDASKVVLVTGINGSTADFGTYTQKVKVMFVDGTSAVVTVDKVGGKDLIAGNVYDASADTLYTYATDKDGNYELTAVTAADYDNVYANDVYVVVDDAKAVVAGATYRFNADAVVFQKIDGKYSVVTGADVNKWDATVDAMTVYGEVKNGFGYVQLAVVVDAANPGSSTTAAYGMITAAPYQTKVGDDQFINITLWNGTANVEYAVKVEGGIALGDAKFAKGALVSYDVVDAKTVKNVTVIGTEGAVKAYDGTFVDFGAGEYKITADTVIIYIDSAKVAGVEGGKIALAGKDDSQNYINNVYYVNKDASVDEVVVLFVDVNNEMDAAVEGNA